MWEIPLISSDHSCPGCVLAPELLLVGTERGKSAVQALLSSSQDTGVLPAQSQTQTAAPHGLLGGKISPSQPEPVHISNHLAHLQLLALLPGRFLQADVEIKALFPDPVITMLIHGHTRSESSFS